MVYKCERAPELEFFPIWKFLKNSSHKIWLVWHLTDG